MNITNKTAKPLPITTGVTLAAGETRYVKDWPRIVSESVILQAWVKERLISVAPRSSLDGLELTDEARGMFVGVTPELSDKTTAEPKEHRRWGLLRPRHNSVDGVDMGSDE